jgi:transcriptional regulator GlxA family with amidase domain
MATRLLEITDWQRLAEEAKFRPGIMAAKCPIGLRQLQRFFAKHFNQSPKAWSKDLQMITARRLIAQGLSNKAVAAELGFGNASHLCHDFKKYFGKSPQAFAPLYGRGHYSYNSSAVNSRMGIV